MHDNINYLADEYLTILIIGWDKNSKKILHTIHSIFIFVDLIKRRHELCVEYKHIIILFSFCLHVIIEGVKEGSRGG
jgi:hypothetical protein